MLLAGKVAIITGASQGIGRALAGCLGDAGCRLVLVARSAPEVEDAAAKLEATEGEPE